MSESGYKNDCKSTACFSFIFWTWSKRGGYFLKKEALRWGSVWAAFGGQTSHLNYPRAMFAKIARAHGYAIIIEQQNI